jgi:hypothetical protein
MNLRTARKVRRNFYRSFRAMEAWRTYKWDRDQGPVFSDIIGKMASKISGYKPEPKPLTVPPLLKKLRKWPVMPSQRLLNESLRRFNAEERLAWRVDFALWNAMVKQETEPLTWASAAKMEHSMGALMNYANKMYETEESHAEAG